MEKEVDKMTNSNMFTCGIPEFFGEECEDLRVFISSLFSCMPHSNLRAVTCFFDLQDNRRLSAAFP